MPSDTTSSENALDFPVLGQATPQDSDKTAHPATADKEKRANGLRLFMQRLLSVLCIIRLKAVQFISLYLLTVFVILIGIFLVEIQQRRELEKQFESGDTTLKMRVNNIIHYGASEDSLANIVDDATPQFRSTGDSNFNDDHYYLSDTLSNMSSRTLLMLAVLLAGWSGSLVGTVYRKENFEFRSSVIGLGASFIVWLGSHSTIQLISLGSRNGQGDPDCFDITLMAFLAGFASHKVMQSLESIPIRGVPGRPDGAPPPITTGTATDSAANVAPPATEKTAPDTNGNPTKPPSPPST